MRPTGLRYAEVRYVPNREVRFVPQNWQHPKGEKGRYVPLLLDQMPKVAQTEETDVVAYETVSEGTPISPAFPNTAAGRVGLTAYCAEHAATWGNYSVDAETWAVILFGEEATISRQGDVVCLSSQRSI